MLKAWSMVLRFGLNSACTPDTSSSAFSFGFYFNSMTLSITLLGCEISINRSATLAEWLSSYFPLLLLGYHQCLVAVSSSVRAPPPTNLLWELVHLPPHFAILLAVGWHLVSACNFRYVYLCTATILSRVPTPQCFRKEFPIRVHPFALLGPACEL